MPEEMLSYVLYGKKDLRCEKRRTHRIQPQEVLVKMKRVGICGSDIHYFEEGRVGNFKVKHPFVIGHEGAGEIVEAGALVSDLSKGMRVAISPSQPCRECPYCTEERSNLCPNMRYLGSAASNPHTDGVFSKYFISPGRNCHIVPDKLGYDEAAMIEPLSVAMHVVERSGMVGRSSVLITGGGTIGQLVMVVMRAFGAGKIAMSEIVTERRELAKAQGADITLDPRDPFVLKKAAEFSDGGFDVIVEASGTPAAAKLGFELVKPGGTIVLVGLSPAEVPLPMNRITSKELQIRGSYRFDDDFSDAIRLAASGRIQVRPLITHTLPFGKMQQAIELAGSRGAAIKVQVEI